MTVTALFAPADRTVLADMVEDLACQALQGKDVLPRLAQLLACPADERLECALDGVREAAWVRDQLALGAMCWQDRYSHDDLTGFGSNAEAAMQMSAEQADDEIQALISTFGGRS